MSRISRNRQTDLGQSTPSVKFRGDRILISAERLAAMGKKLPPDRPKGDAVIECSGGVYYWVEVPSDD